MKMKRIISILLTFIPAMGLWAEQSMFIYQGSVVTMADLEDIATMTFNDTTKLIVNGIEFPINEIDSIVVGNEAFQKDSIIVNYSMTSAKVFIPLNVLPHQSVKVEGAHVKITSSLTETDPNAVEVKYSLSGSTLKGSFYQEGAYKCTLVLNGVNITSNKGPAIQMYNGKRIDIVVADGTTNSLKDPVTGDHKACMAIKGHAEFKGAGTLNILGQTYHAYKSNEYTIMKKTFTGNLNITGAARDGMHVGQYFQMNNGNISINNIKTDALQVEETTETTDEFNGQMFLNSGTINIVAKGDTISGLKCAKLLTVTGGNYQITMNGKGAKGVKTYQADINTKTAPTLIDITVNAGHLKSGSTTVGKTIAFKTDHDMWFRSGTIKVTNNDVTKKAHGIDVGNNYYYTGKGVSNVEPDVDGTMKYITE